MIDVVLLVILTTLCAATFFAGGIAAIQIAEKGAFLWFMMAVGIGSAALIFYHGGVNMHADEVTLNNWMVVGVVIGFIILVLSTQVRAQKKISENK